MRRQVRWMLAGVGSILVAAACGSDAQSPPSPDASAGGQGGEGETPLPPAGTAGMAPLPNDGGMGGTPTVVMPMAGAGIGGASGAGGAAEPESPDVHGVFLDFELAPLTIALQLNGVSVVVDDQGKFEVANVADAYELMIYLPEYKIVKIYDGLRTRQPRIDLGLALGTTPAHGASIRGKVTGGLQVPFPVADDITVFTEVAYVSDAYGPLYPRASIDPPEGYDVDPQWNGLASDIGEVLALQSTFKDGVGFIEYTGFGRRKMTIEDGEIYGSLSGSPLTDIALTKPPQTVRDGNLVVPSGWMADSAALNSGPFSTYSGIDVGAFSILVPQLEGISPWVALQLSGPDGSSELHLPVPSAAPWQMVSAPPPKPLVPVDKASAVNLKTQFTWSGVPEDTIAGVYCFVGDWSVEHYTTKTSVTLPDLSAFGAALPAGAEGAWVVRAVGPANTTDGVLTAWHEYYADEGKPMLIYESALRDFSYVN